MAFDLSVDTLEKASRATRTAAGAAAVSALLTLGLIWFTTSQGGPFTGTLDVWSLLDVALVAALGFGVYRKSRVSAVALLLYYLWGQVSIRMDMGSTGGLGLVVVFVLFYVQGIRGAFAYHRLSADADGAERSAPIEEERS